MALLPLRSLQEIYASYESSFVGSSRYLRGVSFWEGLRSENKSCGGRVNHWPGFSQLGLVLIANQTITTRPKCSRETGNFSNIKRSWAIMPVACKPKHDYQGACWVWGREGGCRCWCTHALGGATVQRSICCWFLHCTGV